jgi:putative redox protein
VDLRFRSGDVILGGALARPGGSTPPRQALVLCHGFPAVPGGAEFAALTTEHLGERLAASLGWLVLSFAFRGCGPSEGNFSLEGWMADLRAAVDRVAAEPGVAGIWLAGFGTGGALAICAAERDPRVIGIGSLAAPAGFEDWASHPRRLLEFARETGVIRLAGFPPSFDRWAAELRNVHPLSAAESIRARPLLVVHGGDDQSVPVFDARLIADAHGQADFRPIPGASHDLALDPRAVAVLMGWLERQAIPV